MMNDFGSKDEAIERFDNGASEYGNDFFSEDPVVGNISIPNVSKNQLHTNNYRMQYSGGTGGPVKATAPL
jgi:hypothetical protein